MGETVCEFRKESVLCGLHVCRNPLVPWTHCERAMNENQKVCPTDPELHLTQDIDTMPSELAQSIAGSVTER